MLMLSYILARFAMFAFPHDGESTLPKFLPEVVDVLDSSVRAKIIVGQRNTRQWYPCLTRDSFNLSTWRRQETTKLRPLSRAIPMQTDSEHAYDDLRERGIRG